MNHGVASRPDFGNEPPLIADRRRRPDRRQVSARWLAGTLLTGLTSSALMGIALSAALDGHRDMMSPGRVTAGSRTRDADFPKGERVFATAIPTSRSRQTIEVSTMTKEGDREVVRTLPFAYVNMALAARHPTAVSYPPFDAMKVFSDGAGPAKEVPADPSQIYGAKVESEMSLKVQPFTFDRGEFDGSGDISSTEAEALVHAALPTLADKPVQVASIEPVDPLRFAPQDDVPDYEPGSAFRVIDENVSVAAPDEPNESARYREEIIPFREKRKIAEALTESGYQGAEVGAADARIAGLIGTDVLEPGDVLRIGAERAASEGSATQPRWPRIVRLSIYRGQDHIVTIAVDDSGSFEPAAAPAISQAVAEAFDENATETPRRADMPTVYDGIYQAALFYGLDGRLCQQLVRILSSDVDFQARLNSDDRLTVLYSLREGEEAATDESQILYVEAKFGDLSKRYYRFRSPDDDHVDYYDEDGRSSKQFLLRSPVPNGRFTSPFGARVHPVLGYARPHWGVDWAAPSGTPILASGSGTVESAGWTTGYGRQTVIRHANGYETSYSHQSGIASGVTEGSHVRQGQIIGYVGSTGLSTGNHLHYEVIVNGQKVDPMRIRLPADKALDGEQLDTFKRERERIDRLMEERAGSAHVADR